METIGTRQMVLKALQEAKDPIGIRDVMASAGLRKAVVTGALYRMKEKGVVELSVSPAGFSLFKWTGKEDNSQTRVVTEKRRTPRKHKPDTRGVEFVVRVLDNKGNILELSVEQALEVERQLSAFRATLAAMSSKGL